MRLTKPVLNYSVPFGSERADLAFESVSANHTSQARIAGTDALGISPLLILPSSFGLTSFTSVSFVVIYTSFGFFKKPKYY